jgi:hypothetical protein
MVYPALQNAYNGASDGASILLGEGVLVGAFTANRAITASIGGGYNDAFNSNPGYTVLNGKVTLKAGKVIFNRIRVR